MIDFMNNIIIPEKIGSYYLIPQKVLGFDITHQSIRACQIYYKGASIRIERFFHQPIDTKSGSYEDALITALKEIIKNADTVDSIRVSIPSAQSIVKKLTLPFSNTDKISEILKYELEAYLPFALSQTVADFIPLQNDPVKNSTTVLAVALPKSTLQEYLNYFTGAGVKPEVVTIDILNLYGLYKSIPAYQENRETTLLIDYDLTVTRVAYLVDGVLNNTRTIQKGLSSLAKEIAQELQCSPHEALEKIIRFGFAPNSDLSYSSALTKAMQPFLSDLQFTLQSFTDQAPATISQAFILGQGATISNAAKYMSEQLAIPCTQFDISSLFKLPNVTLNKGLSIEQNSLMALASAFISPLMNSFNMKSESSQDEQARLFNKQIITAGILFFVLLGTLMFHSYRQSSRLQKLAKESEQQIVSLLRKDGLTDSKILSKALAESHDKVEEQETIWFAFSKQTRISFLKYLERLSTAIDRVGIGLKLDKLVITQRDNDYVLTLQGQVKDFDALKTLERELRESNLFVYVPSFQTKNFNEEIPLKKNGEEV